MIQLHCILGRRGLRVRYVVEDTYHIVYCVCTNTFKKQDIFIYVSVLGLSNAETSKTVGPIQNQLKPLSFWNFHLQPVNLTSMLMHSSMQVRSCSKNFNPLNCIAIGCRARWCKCHGWSSKLWRRLLKVPFTAPLVQSGELGWSSRKCQDYPKKIEITTEVDDLFTDGWLFPTSVGSESFCMFFSQQVPKSATIGRELSHDLCRTAATRNS